MCDGSENIKLTLPINAAYVSSARLTASSIANRMGFDVDEMEDIKTAVSEACTFIIKTMNPADKHDFTLLFQLNKIRLDIDIHTIAPISSHNWNEEMGLVMIRALMDEFELTHTPDNHFRIKMAKSHKEVSFD